MGKSVQEVLGVSMEKIREMVNADTVVGTPIVTDGVTIIPVSRLSYGFAGGGSDLPTKVPGDKFGGGSGAGVSVVPIAFLAIKEGNVQVLPLVTRPDTTDSALSMIPDAIDKLSDLILQLKKDKKEKKEETTAE